MKGEALAGGVLSALLDKYESSEAFRKGEPTQARIQLRLTDSVVAGYASGRLDPDDRALLHTALLAMEDRGFIALKWVKFEQGNILERVYLEWERIDDVYQYIGRTPQREKLAAFTAEIDGWLKDLLIEDLPDEWHFLLQWVDDVFSFVRERGRIPSSLIPEEEESRALLLHALAGLVWMRNKSLPVRLFSKQELGNSKVFEKQVQSHVVRLLRRYWCVSHPLEVEAPDDDATLLRELGIESGHEDITFCGPIRFRYVDSEGTDTAGDIDASVFPYGLAIDASDVHRIAITEAPISRIVTIENKANYRAYVRAGRQPDELVVYLGGFASPAQRVFLRLLRNFLLCPTGEESAASDTLGVSAVDALGVPAVDTLGVPAVDTLGVPASDTTGVLASETLGVPGVDSGKSGVGLGDKPRVILHHWGDLDYGGILILQNLRNSCWPEVEPWRMEPELLDENMDYAEQIDDAYRTKLARLLESEVYAWAHPLIRRILMKNATLEQEALLLSE